MLYCPCRGPMQLNAAIECTLTREAHQGAQRTMKCWVVRQGAFRKVAVEASACAKELTWTLKQRLLHHKEEAAECIQMLRKLGEPVESLQVTLLFTLMGYNYCIVINTRSAN